MKISKKYQAQRIRHANSKLELVEFFDQLIKKYNLTTDDMIYILAEQQMWFARQGMELESEVI